MRDRVNQFRQSLLPVFSVGLFLAAMISVKAADLHVGAAQPFGTIQSAVDAATAGDRIIIHQGTYEEYINITTQQLTLTGAYGENRPLIQGDRLDGDKGDYVVNVPAAHVTLKDLEISNKNGNGEYGYLVVNDGANMTVDNCVIHNGRYGVKGSGDNLTVTNCEIKDFLRDGVYFDGSGGCTVKGNWIHGATSWENFENTTRTYGVRVDAPAGSVGTTVEVSYNYLSGTRTGIVYRADTSGSPTGTVLLSHNTIDGTIDVGGGTYLTPWGEMSFMRSGIDLFSTTVDPNNNTLPPTTFNAANITIRDNLIANCWWYGMYFGTTAEGGYLIGDLPVGNPLFFNNFSYDGWWPGNRYPEEYPNRSGVPDTAPPGSRTEAGWVTIGGDLVFDPATAVIADPLFTKNSLTGPEDYYALLPASPGWNAASDGTHIGAWQSIPEPGMLALFLMASTVLFRRPVRRE